MLVQILSTIVVVASAVTAHFSITSPEMRGDPFATPASEWVYPCKFTLPSSTSLFHLFYPISLSYRAYNCTGGNVNQTSATNRTLWPLTGGSLNLDLHHPWTYVFVNLGLGTEYPTFNISLTAQPLNETGNGTLCLPQVKIPAGVTVLEGQNASIQVVTVGASGSGLYVVSAPLLITIRVSFS
jgi:hypothetical protein